MEDKGNTELNVNSPLYQLSYGLVKSLHDNMVGTVDRDVLPKFHTFIGSLSDLVKGRDSRGTSQSTQ